MYKITEKDIEYCEWVTRKFYAEKNVKPTEDDMQDAMTEMSLAATRFDKSVGVMFPSYAKPYLRKSMLMKTSKFRKNGDALRADIFRMGDRKAGGVDYDIMDKFYGNQDVEKDVINKDSIEKAMAQFPDKVKNALYRKIMGGEKYADIADDYEYSNPNSLNKTVRDWCKRVQGGAGA